MLKRSSGKLLRKHMRNPRRVQRHFHGLPRFALGAFFAVGKCVARVSTCVREETGNRRCVTLGLLCVRKNHHATKNCCVLTPQAHGCVSMRTETCSCERTAAISRRPIGNAHQNAAFSPWGHTCIAIHAQEDMDLNP